MTDHIQTIRMHVFVLAKVKQIQNYIPIVRHVETDFYLHWV